MVVLGGWAFSYEQGTPIELGVSGFGFRVSGLGVYTPEPLGGLGSRVHHLGSGFRV